MKLKKYISILTLSLTLLFSVAPHQQAEAIPLTVILQVIKAGVKKVIKAIDLKVQRLQNKTIWLQNVQKVLENTLSKLSLKEISGWNDKQRQQYDALFEELWKVKSALDQYRQVKDIAEKQAQLVEEYHRVWPVLSAHEAFSPEEKQAMAATYSEILGRSLENLDYLLDVMTAFTVQMNDAERLRIIHDTDQRVTENLNALRSFNRRNLSIAENRSRTQVQPLKKLYEK
ncbi:hypothetical protein [Echinicola vietnamensis]|uniref:Conjugal transfer protein TraI n=1 Tax=Echinicola vietnamensis (strain DSM 17526 / LMG 23754 / KMM 6221) TaxID=926556 RepID=L0FYB7_ECHVK|nr:hypothetical protein [Echinicola vietnamensis]AGA77630.1 hypothetical protein Echvi_1361 [Echinicola vietnamensis DSM 17526]